MGAQTAQAGKMGLAVGATASGRGGGSFAEMQRQVRKQVQEDIGQLGRDIKTTEEMSSIKMQQSLLGDQGLQKVAGQSTDAAFWGGLLGGGLSGFQEAGGDVTGAVEGAITGIGTALQPGIDQALAKRRQQRASR